ncbi:MFS transporter [Bradyrhizobium sp. ARR65]|uniref:MFS transporter n=1 Tax=Bradyrhizobium sp. ARR65 TaxID=1040989 RepID=UPI0004630702|nr:MFS transporter [Bradyrhizobium sp. ARR65]
MPPESQIPTAADRAARRFAARLALFYGALFGLTGTELPFFPVWLRAVGIDPWWIGIISAVPAVTRFTTLPFVTSFAEKRHALRGALIVTATACTFGFAIVGTQHQTIAVFLAFVATACAWTPMVPLTDAYALRGVVRYGINYGPVRLWGSAAFILGALACGLVIDVIDPRRLIWIIVAVAGLAALTSLALQPLDTPPQAAATHPRDHRLLRDLGFLAIIVASALIQGSHAAYYTFSAITWQAHGLGGFTIAALWALGVLAEIVVFAASPRFTLAPSMLVTIGALSAVARWSITAQEPQLALLGLVQLAHGLTFGLTQVGTMELLVRHVPVHMMARGQGYYTACSGILSSCASIVSGAIYAHYGQGVYYLMAAMAASGAMLMWLARHRLAQPHSAASGG